jgi:hypothetical protein
MIVGRPVLRRANVYGSAVNSYRGNPVISFFMSLLVLALMLWGVKWFIAQLPLPDNIRQIVLVIVALVFLAALLNRAGVMPGW